MSQILREKNEEQARYKMIFGTKDFEFNRAASEKKWVLASQTSKSQKKDGISPMNSGILSDSTTARKEG